MLSVPESVVNTKVCLLAVLLLLLGERQMELITKYDQRLNVSRSLLLNFLDSCTI